MSYRGLTLIAVFGWLVHSESTYILDHRTTGGHGCLVRGNNCSRIDVIMNLATAFLRPKKNGAPVESREARSEIRRRRLHPETVRSDDTFVVSYPKSGSTWQRFLIANLLRPNEPISFLNVNGIVPDVYQTSEEELANHPSPRILKSHDAFTPRFPRSIYITRDPRSVAVSIFHFWVACGKLR